MSETSRLHLIAEKDAAKLLGLTRRGLQNFRATGRGPNFVRISRGCDRYRPEDLEVWIEERMATSTADTTEAETKASSQEQCTSKRYTS